MIKIDLHFSRLQEIKEMTNWKGAFKWRAENHPDPLLL